MTHILYEQRFAHVYAIFSTHCDAYVLHLCNMSGMANILREELVSGFTSAVFHFNPLGLPLWSSHELFGGIWKDNPHRRQSHAILC